MLKKRGQVEIQFNWIFIFVIGVVILGIGINIIPKLQTTSEQSVSVDLQAHLDGMVSSIQYDLDAQNSFNLYGQEIYLSCNSYELKESDVMSASIENSIIFSPNVISKNLLGTAKLIEQPNKFAYASFITSPDIKYVLVRSSESDLLLKELPNNIDRVLSSNINEIPKSGYYKLKIITFGNVPSAQGITADIGDENITLIKIDVLRDKDKFPNSFGVISFYQKNNNNFELTKESYFFDKATLVGALYAENQEMHMCNLQKAIKKLNLVSKINLDRTTSFAESPELKTCPYEESIQKLNQFIQDTTEPLDTKAYFEGIYIQSDSIRLENIMLKRLSCPLIY